MAKKTCSATERAFTPGTLATSTPAAVAASIGIMSSPAPWRMAAFSFLAVENNASGSGARTTTMSASVASRASVAASRAEAILNSPASTSMALAFGCSAWVERIRGMMDRNSRS